MKKNLGGLIIAALTVVAVSGTLAPPADARADEEGRSAGKVNVSAEITNLKSKSSQRRNESIDKLSKVGRDKKVEKAMIDACGTEYDQNVKKKLYRALGGVGGRDAKEYLTERLNTEKKSSARESIVLSLGQTQQPDAAPVLRKIFLDRNEDMSVRMQAANGLSYISEKDSVNALAEGLQDENADIRIQAICSLSNIGGDVLTSERMEMIRKTAKEDTSEKVRNYAKETLEVKYNIKETRPE